MFASSLCCFVFFRQIHSPCPGRCLETNLEIKRAKSCVFHDFSFVLRSGRRPGSTFHAPQHPFWRRRRPTRGARVRWSRFLIYGQAAAAAATGGPATNSGYLMEHISHRASQCRGQPFGDHMTQPERRRRSERCHTKHTNPLPYTQRQWVKIMR